MGSGEHRTFLSRCRCSRARDPARRRYLSSIKSAARIQSNGWLAYLIKPFEDYDRNDALERVSAATVIGQRIDAG